MNLKPAKTKRIYEEIVDQISTLVAEGQIKAGDKLPSERDLAERLQVSRASVREALSALEIMGLLEIRSGEGTYIKHVNIESVIAPLPWVLSLEKDTIFELMEIRKILETQAAALAAERAEYQDLSAMRGSLFEIRKGQNTDRHGYPCDRDFHDAIAKGTKNKMLIHMLHMISDIMHQTLKMNWADTFEKEGMSELLYQEHEEIYQAIEAELPEEAHAGMLRHLERIENEFRKGYE
ncbi:Lactate-responsive regulator LldR in Firmicute, GntR family [Dehalobacter sp. UNSWDHB]|uniref:FadR/GntR family transcriptional regulator n=1 Tax=Dehalobacter sp. UNSWDHB TaxID=1339256 RepID=UPI00038D7D4A|nr:FCD domain-containing protein [Dehalobacter sp. UNSWDHB]EQB20793.1 Lactate-responsive regulator LldR in Firmicute, GntR family [Dehalobacter sp. UNSWDHB]